jgi:hypothetical protein
MTFLIRLKSFPYHLLKIKPIHFQILLFDFCQEYLNNFSLLGTFFCILLTNSVLNITHRKYIYLQGTTLLEVCSDLLHSQIFNDFFLFFKAFVLYQSFNDLILFFDISIFGIHFIFDSMRYWKSKLLEWLVHWYIKLNSINRIQQLVWYHSYSWENIWERKRTFLIKRGMILLAENSTPDEEEEIGEKSILHQLS